MIKGHSVIECGISDLSFIEMQKDIHHFVQIFKDVELIVDMETEEKTFVTIVFTNATLYDREFSNDEISIIRILDLYQYVGE